jgi:anaerobic glycerol-3-phosphate dehydrogenase
MATLFLLLLSVLAIGYSPAPIVPPAATSVEISAAPIAAIETYLSQQKNISAADLTLQQVETVEWSDSCLDLPRPDELCAQAITPGFRVEFATPQKRYVVHTDRSGRLIRLKS